MGALGHLRPQWSFVADHQIKADKEVVAVWVGFGLPAACDTAARESDVRGREFAFLYRQVPTCRTTIVDEIIRLGDGEIEDVSPAGVGMGIRVQH
ncbi:hypothetical protein XU18_3897 [Perkinsela sp. CCAP 1560/4]|nr:hypothetical protein XU18_3897 [Perkinsela sp. CCAP 1560/4]|eukprot:KNH04968.1 hypothetical protein XU18_3897 [Perkinsela sp. CCAP 1560/4]